MRENIRKVIKLSAKQHQLSDHNQRHVRSSESELVLQQLEWKIYDSAFFHALKGIQWKLEEKEDMLRWIIARLSSELALANRVNLDKRVSFVHSRFFHLEKFGHYSRSGETIESRQFVHAHMSPNNAKTIISSVRGHVASRFERRAS